MNKLQLKILSILQLCRIPNLFTLPGDILIGFIIVHGNDYKKLIYTILTSLFIYCYGLVSNDIADFAIDKKNRVMRPIPSGAISLYSAILIMLITLSLSFVFAWFAGINVLLVNVILFILITIYNFKFKKNIYFGPLLLALCRMFNIILGIVAGGQIAFNTEILILWFVLVSIGLYIFGVSRIAQTEVKSKRNVLSIRSIFAGNILLTIMTFTFNTWDFFGTISIVFNFLFVIVSIFYSFKCFNNLDSDISKYVGKLIQNILLFQITLCAMYHSFAVCLFLLLLIPVMLILNKYFYSS